MRTVYLLFTTLSLVLFLTACERQVVRTPSNELSGGEPEELHFIGVTPQSEELHFIGVTPESEPVTRPRERPAGLNTTPVVPRGREYRAALTGINTHFNPSCRNFISSDGSLGSWGTQMIAAMRRVESAKGRSCFFGRSSAAIKFGQRCRSTEYFQGLTQSQQEHIWVWLWASVAQAESSCQTDVQVNGIWNRRYGRYNRADGLFQLEYNTQTRNANGRDRRFCPDSTNSQALTFQFECAASIMADTQCGDYLKDSGSYWQKLRSSRGQIWNLLSRHPLCR